MSKSTGRKKSPKQVSIGSLLEKLYNQDGLTDNEYNTYLELKAYFLRREKELTRNRQDD